MATAAIAIRPRVPEDISPGTKYADQEKRSQGQVLPPQKAGEFLLLTKPSGAIPRAILFGALESSDLRLVKPIPLKTEKTKGTVSVVWEEINEFGYGGTLSEAIFDFAATVTELHVTLSEKESLSDDLLEVRNKLSEYIELRPR